MTPTSLVLQAAERLPIPDAVLRRGIETLVAATAKRMAGLGADAEASFARDMAGHPIAEHADAANAQHYEVPAAFFALVLGPRRKYSSCLYRGPADTLGEAEEHALAATAEHAALADGQRILELGCGWGSLSLWMAERYPAAHIVSVSNSASQRTHIEGEARARGLANLRVVTADMNGFDPRARFDRVVSVEMFEHMANWRALLGRVRGWIEQDGRLFLHVFTHRTAPYRFDHRDPADWVAQHFFTGGIMPSQGLARQFPELFTVEEEWRWSGTHYGRTAEDWLRNFDANERAIGAMFETVYGADAAVWKRRWRLFFLATAGLFGFRDGTVWGVGHYRLKPAG